MSDKLAIFLVATFAVSEPVGEGADLDPNGPDTPTCTSQRNRFQEVDFASFSRVEAGFFWRKTQFTTMDEEENGAPGALFFKFIGKFQ